MYGSKYGNNLLCFRYTLKDNKRELFPCGESFQEKSVIEEKIHNVVFNSRWPRTVSVKQR